MEKSLPEIKGLAKKIFNINGFSGRMGTVKASRPENMDNVLIWDNSFISNRSPVVKIVPSIDAVYVLDVKYSDEAIEFAEQYESQFNCHVALRYSLP